MMSAPPLLLMLLTVLPGLVAGLDIAWLAPLSLNSDTKVTSSVGGMALAIDKINSDNSLLAGNTISVEWHDSGCNSKQSIASVYDILNTANFVNPDVIVGPPCSESMLYVGQLAGYRSIPIFGWQSPSEGLAADAYTSLVRVYVPKNTLAAGFLLLLESFDWTRVAVVAGTDTDSQDLFNAITSKFGDRVNITRTQDQANPGDTEYMDEAFRQIKKVARIVILAVPRSELVAWMKMAKKKGMTKKEYVYIWVNAEVPTQFLYDILTSADFYENDNDAKAAFKSLLVLSPSLDHVAAESEFLSKADTAGQAQITTILGAGYTAAPSDITSPYLHDAVILWAKLANEANNAGEDLKDGTVLKNRAKSRAFIGNTWATGNIYLDENGDREPDFWLMDLNDNNVFHTARKLVHTSAGSGFQREVTVVEDIIWSDGSRGDAEKPLAVPVCGFAGENCFDYNVNVVLPCVLIAVILLVVIIIIVLYRKYQFEQSLKDMMWKINREDMISKADKKLQGSAMLQLSRASSIKRSRMSNLGGAPSTSRGVHRSHMDMSKGGESGSQHTHEDGQIFINTAQYKGNTVAWKKVRKERVKLDRNLMVEMKNMTDIKCPNVAVFIGSSVEAGDIFEVWEYCPKGSLQDVIWNDNIKLDEMFKFSLSTDIFKGLKYLHDSPLKVHGRLKSSNCVIDVRWTCKLTDYGLKEFRNGQEEDPEMSVAKKNSELMWTAPELLRSLDKDGRVTKPTQEADIYAAAIILKEIFARNGPYTEQDYMDPEEIINEIKNPKNPKQMFRPELTDLKNSPMKALNKLVNYITYGWSEKPGDRPPASKMIRGIQSCSPNKSTNVMDNIINMMERYSNNLEEMIQERTMEIEEEKKKSDHLLERMLPKPVAEDLRVGKTVSPENFDSVSIYFSDIVSFTKLAGQSSPMQVVDLLNDLYTIFDSAIAKHDVYKVETIGDAYMYVSGLPIRNGDKHAVEVTNCAMDLLSGIVGFKVRHLPDYVLSIRIGLHTGPVVAGVVGMTMPRYCLFGDTVTIASTMESGGSPMRIHMSEFTYKLVAKYAGYNLADRGTMEVMGKKLTTYFLVSREGYMEPFPDYDELAVVDNPPCKKLPTTRGPRQSKESGFFDMNAAGGGGGMDTLSTGDVALSRKTSAAASEPLDDILETETTHEQFSPEVTAQQAE